MSATAAVNRPPPAHPGPNGGNPHTRTNGEGPPSQQQDPGLRCTSQDPGPSSQPQQHFSARPVFYVHAPPQPPFLHYQWPMPFPYNPFTGFPGMGYGMVMPPFPPPPYMEAPSYILPHPQLQPVDYRRLLHPQVYAPSAPYQNPYQSRRVHLPHTGPVRETVNSEVQTEPTRRGVGGYGEESPVLSTDSGGGTASNSPSPSSSTSKKRGSAEVENYTLPGSNANDNQVKRTSTCSTVKRCFDVLQPTGLKTVQARIRATLEKQQSLKDCVGQENAPPHRDARCNVWSVSSTDSPVPVCSSSQQEEEVVQERRDSVPDILMSWGGGTAQATADKLPQNDLGTEVEHDQFVYQSPTETTKGPAVADSVFANDADGNLSSRDSATLFKILKMRGAHEDRKAESKSETGSVGLVGSVGHCLPYRDELLRSLNASDKLPGDKHENDETNPHEDTANVTPYQMSLNSSQMKRAMNVSVWSVESLAPFIPTKEWLLQNSMFEPQVIVEMTEETEGGRPSTPDNPIVEASKERRQIIRYSSSDSVLMSDSWLMFSTPAEKPSPPKKPEIESELDASEMRPKPGQNIGPSEKDSVASPTHLPPSKIVLSPATEEDVDTNRSSEPEANQSPNQESLIINEQQEKSPCSREQEEPHHLVSGAGREISPEGQLTLQKEVDVDVDAEAEDEACGNKEVSQPKNQQLCVPMADQKVAEVSPSKGRLVDCGVQCTELQEHTCNCKEEEKHHFKYTDKKAHNGQAEGFSMKGRMQRNQKKSHWKNRGQGKAMHREWVEPMQPPSSEKQSSQQEAYNRYYGKAEKPQGGNGRNSRY